MTDNKLLKLSVAVYLMIAIVTYGNAINHFDKVGKSEVEYCKATEKNTDFCESHRSYGIAGTISTLLWPLYWSYRLQRGV